MKKIIPIIFLIILIPLTSCQGIYCLNRTKIENKINRQREIKNLKTLKPNHKLRKIARLRVNEIIRKNEYRHNLNSLQKLPNRVGYKNWERIGEIIGRKWKSEKALVKAWKGSKTHRREMFRKKYKDIGCYSKRLYNNWGNLTVCIFGVRNNK